MASPLVKIIASSWKDKPNNAISSRNFEPLKLKYKKKID